MTLTIEDMVRPWGSEAEQIRDVSERWRLAYKSDDWDKERCYNNQRTNAEVYGALVALPDTATAADVAAIIGNDSWIGQRCTFCGNQRIFGFSIGEPDDYESATVSACTECAELVARMILDK
jgi:hypothetical protein